MNIFKLYAFFLIQFFLFSVPRTTGRTGRHTEREDYLQRQAEEQPVEPAG
jgi:hypothetical protein